MTGVTQTHAKTILLVEDLEDYSIPVTRWLEKDGYQVILARNYQEALACLEREHCHLAIVDIRLIDNDPANNQGIQFLRVKAERGLGDVLPAIVLTAHPSVPNTLEAFQNYHILKFVIKEPSYRQPLSEAVREAFQDHIQINFQLEYALTSDDVLPQYVQGIHWTDQTPPPETIMVLEVQDIIGRLYRDAKTIYLSLLNPGHSGAALGKISPIWQNGDGPAWVLKVDRRHKGERELNHYRTYVDNLLPVGSYPQLMFAFRRYLGGLAYKFVEDAARPFVEFDQFYRENHHVEPILRSLHDLFFDTCQYWFNRGDRKFANLQDEYFSAFDLTMDRLVERFQEVIPGFNPQEKILTMPDTNEGLLNPVHWMTSHRRAFDLLVVICITHGDLTGRNIMVDLRNKCWLIDFYRTYPSHSLRDFVILETDLKYRLSPFLETHEFVQLERELLKLSFDQQRTTAATSFINEETIKLFQVISGLRNDASNIAFGAARPYQKPKEYLLSLLMATLNVVRLRHIPPERKLQAIRSAAMICEHVDRMG